MTQLTVDHLDWRGQLHHYLATHADREVSLRVLWQRFGVTIPLHHATRLWLGKNPSLTLTDEPMRWGALVNELSCFALQRVPDDKRWSLDHVVIPTSRACAWCGGGFAGRRRTVHCSRRCGYKAGEAARQAERARAAIEAFVMPALDAAAD